MGFFSDLREDLSQAVSELVPEEEPVPGKTMGFVEEIPLSETDATSDMTDISMPETADDLSRMLENMDLDSLSGLDAGENTGILGGMEDLESTVDAEPSGHDWMQESIENAENSESIENESIASESAEIEDAEIEGTEIEDAEIEGTEIEDAENKGTEIEDTVNKNMESIKNIESIGSTAGMDGQESAGDAEDQESIEDTEDTEDREMVKEQEEKIILEEEEQVEGTEYEGMDAELSENQEAAVEETAVITAGMVIRGDISSKGSLDVIGGVEGNIDILGKLNISGNIEGSSKAADVYAEKARINGDIQSAGSIKIGQSTIVIGNMYASSAVIAGAVKGDIDVKGPVVLDTSAIVMGNIKSRSVQINNCAVIEGLCSQCYADVNPSSFFEDIKKARK